MIQADVKLDTLGYFCPMPIILTSKKIKELTMGQVLEVVSDDEGIKKDMRWRARSQRTARAASSTSAQPTAPTFSA